MSDLTDALEQGPIGRDPSGRIAVIEAAARRVVAGQPTYLVHTRQSDIDYLGHFYQGDKALSMSKNPNLPGEWLLVIPMTEDEVDRLLVEP